ncbi:MAG: hypothetical protein ACK4Z6_06675 [Candidatus Methylomirabilales bacterium]
MRRSETLSVSIQTSFEKAWAFISDPSNLHRWTVDFAVSPPEKVGDLYRVETPRGVLDLFVKSDRETGVIDFYYGTEGRYQCSPSRLLRNEGGIVYIFTQFEPDNAPPGLFEKLVSNVRRELQILKEWLESQ